MNEVQFYTLYLAALKKALQHEDDWEQYNVKSPEYYLELPENQKKEIDLYLERLAGKDDFLDNVAYYFDAKSHGFDRVGGESLEKVKKDLKMEILEKEKLFGL